MRPFLFNPKGALKYFVSFPKILPPSGLLHHWKSSLKNNFNPPNDYIILHSLQRVHQILNKTMINLHNTVPYKKGTLMGATTHSMITKMLVDQSSNRVYNFWIGEYFPGSFSILLFESQLILNVGTKMVSTTFKRNFHPIFLHRIGMGEGSQ